MKTIQNSFIYIASILVTLRLGFLTYPFYMIVPFLQKNYKFNKNILLYTLFLLSFFLTKSFFEPDKLLSIESFKYYFGFTIFLLLFYSSSNKIKNSLVLLIVIFIISIIIEYFIINYQLLPREYWFNVARPDGTLSHVQTEGDMRPYGIGKNATITATLLVSFYVHIMTEVNYKYLTNLKLKLIITALFLISIIFLRSGTGYFLTIIAFYFIFANTLSKKIIYGLVFGVVFGIIFYIIESNLEGFSRFSLSYVEYLIGFKSEQIFITLLPQDYSFINFLFGALDQRGFTNDIGWVPFFYSVGILGLFMYMIILLWGVNKYNKKSIFILLLGAWHYPAIFSIPGQILFAYLLSRRKKNL